MSAGLLRRCGAILYDSILLFALLMFASMPFVVARTGEAVEPYNLPHQLTLLAVAFAFFVGFWTWRGSTLGMQAWGLRLESVDGGLASLSQASVRFFAAIISWLPLGLGFFWQLCDKDRRSWHDRLSQTRLVYYPK
ncbi:MAG: RDD family protein [Gammaproteobacteria bacterium]|nr:RDD family protein [Gammaproteobacteria bacterium]MDH5303853.1 RDD family protein [Gammaproteobacteria bacterium]MDH5321456.1 RDD family protein [Gammaproteobacteria bacterium]